MEHQTLVIPYGISYMRDAVGNPTEMSLWGNPVTYTYDATNRLGSTSVPQQSYAYDWVGNRTSPYSATYDQADRLTSRTGFS